MKQQIMAQLIRFYPLLLVLVILAAVVFLVIPVFSEIISLKQKIVNERTELEEMYVRGQLLRETQDELSQIEKDLPMVRASILDSGNELLFINTMEQIGQKHNVTVKLSLDELPDHFDKITSLPTTIELEGTFEQVVGFMQDTESLDFYTSWNIVSIRSSTQDPRGRITSRQIPSNNPSDEEELSEDTLRVTLQGETFWRPNEKNLEKPNKKDRESRDTGS